MDLKITPTTINALHMVAAILPSAAASALLGSGGNTYIATSLFASTVLSAVAQSFHFSATTRNIINNLPMIVAAVSKAAETNVADVVDAK
jgi:hypothetical protein